MTPVQYAIHQIKSARLYTDDLLNHVAETDWFRQPTEGVTHIAWQAGHLAVCEYGLALKRVRGVLPADEELVTARDFELFGKGSVPMADSREYPSPNEIRELMNRVHATVLSELAGIDEVVFEEPASTPPHPMFNTKHGALVWCAQHEFLHAGQIGLIRRLLGQTCLR